MNLTNTSGFVNSSIYNLTNKTIEFVNATKPYLNQKTLKGFGEWLWVKYSSIVPHWFTFILLVVFFLYFTYDRLFVHPIQDRAMKGGIGFVSLAIMILIAWLIYQNT